MGTRKSGKIVRWDDTRGFGFIRAAAPGPDVFLHVRDYRSRSGIPLKPGLAVTFEDIHVGGKGPRAMAVLAASEAASSSATVARPARRSASSTAGPPPGSGAWWAVPLMALYAGLLVAAVWTAKLPWWVLPTSCFINLLTFFLYWKDKYAASKGLWRTSESTLQLWSLAGGWPGAWFAQQVLRHKSVKASFRAAYGSTVVLHVAGVAGILWKLGMF